MSEVLTNSPVSSGNLISRRNMARSAGLAVLSILGGWAWKGVQEKQKLTSECDAIVPAIWASIPQDLSDREKTQLLQEKFNVQWSKENPTIRWSVRGSEVIASRKDDMNIMQEYQLVRWYEKQSDNTLVGTR